MRMRWILLVGVVGVLGCGENTESPEQEVNPAGALSKGDEMETPTTKLEFDEHEDDWWICTSFQLHPDTDPFSLTLTSETRPDQAHIATAMKVLESIDDLRLKAAKLILQNYSYKHFKDLGVEESLLLKEETPEAMKKVATLESVCFYNRECTLFEMSFSVPWDEEHSFDVEFEGDEAVTCAVNG